MINAVNAQFSRFVEFAEDPFGAAEKIDKFCTYLENNGPAALSVADGKDVDLNRLFKKVVG